MSADLHSRVEDLHRKIEGLYLKSPPGADHMPEGLPGLLSDLRNLLEEIMVSQEELLHNSEDLARTRESAEVKRHHYQEIFDKSPECQIITDPSGYIIEANLAARRLLGSGYAKGKSLITYIPEGLRRSLKLSLERLDGCEGTVRWNGRISPPSSEQAPIAVAISLSPIRGLGAEPPGLQWIIHLEDAELRAHVAEKHADVLDAAISSIADGVLIIDSSGEILRMNPSAREMMGCFEGRPDRSVLGRLSPLNAVPLDGGSVEHSSSIALRALSGERISGEPWIIHGIESANSTKVSVSASPLRGKDGALLGAVATLVDITGYLDLRDRLEAERHRSDDLAAEAGRRAEELDAIFDAINEPVIIYDLSGSPVRSNFAAIFSFGLDPSRPGEGGMSRKPVLVYPDGRLVQDDDLPSVRALRGEVVKGERFTFIDQDGRKKVIMVTATSIASGSEIYGAVAVWHDITEVDGLARQLQLERERLVAVLRQMPSGVIIAEAPTGRLIMGNNKVRHIWRHPFMPVESIEGYSVYRGYHQDGRPYTPEEWPLARSIIKGEVVIGEEIDILRGDGTRGTISMSSSPIFDRNADVHSAVATFNDITDHRRMVSALREREAQYRLLFESANDGVLLYELQADGTPGMFVHANAAICRMLSYTQEEMGLLSLQDIQSRNSIAGGWKLSSEEELIGKDGISIRAEISSSVFDLNGKKLALAIVRDVTERKMIEDELKLSRDSLAQSVRESTAKLEAAVRELTESEERYKCLVEHSPEPIALIVRGRFAYINPAAVELLGGFGGGDIAGRKVMDFVSPGHRAYAGSIERKIKEDGSAGPEELKIVLQNGTSLDIEVTCVRVLYQGKPALLALAKDLTMRKRAMAAVQRARQAAEAAARIKFEFLEGVSHEIRTPMNSIMGMTSLLMCTDLDSDQRKYAETIHSSSDTLLSVLNEILDFSRMEEGGLEIEMQPFDLLSCIEDSMDLVAGAAAEKGLEMAHDIKAPGCIVGDVALLRQALFYILSNAVKFTNRGEILVSAEAHEVVDGRHELQFSIRDTGIGISKSQLARLFKPFGYLGGHSSGYGGLGLGLAISKGIVEAMGGTIWAESAPGIGSTFHFSIVAGSCTDVPGLPASAPGLEGMKVLVVNGSGLVRDHLTRLMESRGMAVSKAASAAEAMGLAQKERFDAALIDVILPDMDSSSLASEMRRVSPGIYIVAVSHGTPEPCRVFDSFITKPVRSTRLIEALHELAGIRREDAAPYQACATRILVAEDNIVNQKVALLMLSRLGYAADVAANGRETLEALERQHYDIVLMDLKMPQLNGFEATKEILRRWPESRPRIIAMTAYALKGDREQCLQAGMDDYISKPISIEELRMALQRLGP